MLFEVTARVVLPITYFVKCDLLLTKWLPKFALSHPFSTFRCKKETVENPIFRRIALEPIS